MPTYGVNGEFSVVNGTSFSAPIVTGIAAQLKSFFPTLSNLQIADAILCSARLPNHMQPVHYNPSVFGSGLVNFPGAYEACVQLLHTQQQVYQFS